MDVKQHALFNSKACATETKDMEPTELTKEYYEKAEKMCMERSVKCG